MRATRAGDGDSASGDAAAADEACVADVERPQRAVQTRENAGNPVYTSRLPIWACTHPHATTTTYIKKKFLPT